jgi:hypothetical protein
MKLGDSVSSKAESEALILAMSHFSLSLEMFLRHVISRHEHDTSNRLKDGEAILRSEREVAQLRRRTTIPMPAPSAAPIQIESPQARASVGRRLLSHMTRGETSLLRASMCMRS